jgi:acetyl esterase/lipase
MPHDPQLGALLLVLSGGLTAFSALFIAFPPRRPGPLALLGFVAAWLSAELAPQRLGLALLLSGVGVVLGGASSWPGLVGLAAMPLAVPPVLRGARDAADALRAGEMVLGRRLDAPARRPWWAWPLFFVYASRSVTRETVAYGAHWRQTIDLYRPRTPPPGGPRGRLVYVHGGGWVLGFRRWQGRLLFRHLVSRGWEVASVGYRLAPGVTWPAPLLDVRSAVASLAARAWTNPAVPLFIAGNSAGGHLAARLTLAEDGPEVAGNLLFYGVFDLLDRHGHWPHSALRHLWERLVAKRPLEAARPLFSDASPLEHALAARARGRQLPPTLLIHGAADTLVPPAESRVLSEALDGARLVEIPGAQHVFDIFWSWRALAAVSIATAWLEAEVHRALARRPEVRQPEVS